MPTLAPYWDEKHPLAWRVAVLADANRVLRREKAPRAAWCVLTEVLEHSCQLTDDPGQITVASLCQSLEISPDTLARAFDWLTARGILRVGRNAAGHVLRIWPDYQAIHRAANNRVTAPQTSAEMRRDLPAPPPAPPPVAVAVSSYCKERPRPTQEQARLVSNIASPATATDTAQRWNGWTTTWNLAAVYGRPQNDNRQGRARAAGPPTWGSA